MHREKHKFFSLLLLLLTRIFIVHVIAADDGVIMAQLARSIIPAPPDWTGPTFCKWQGISCGSGSSSNRVTSISLSSRSLSGTIPPTLNQLSSLKSLSLQKNHFSGPAPSLSNMPSLEQVYLDGNSFDSIPPNFLSGLTSLQSFSIENNSNLLPWTIPETLKGSPSLTTFIASKSNVFGPIPNIFGSLPNFNTLRLGNNNMTGPLPPSFAKSGIRTLMLNNQASGFTGPLYVLGSMAQLEVVTLQSNQFSGPIPDLSACKELTDLQLRDNSLTGVIPGSLTTLPKLQTIFLQNNKFQGPIPSFPTGTNINLGTTNSFCLPTPGPCDPQVAALLEVAGALNYPLSLADSWKGNDPCQKWNFITCEEGKVTIVNFGMQNWTGMIAPGFAKLTGLKSIFLNDNKLFGTIPPGLTGLSQLQTLDLSNNDLSGKVPTFRPSVNVKLSGNKNIGKDVPITAPPGFPPNTNGLPSNGNGSSSSKKVSPWAIVIPIIVLIVVFSVLGFIFYRRRVIKKNLFPWDIEKSGTKSDQAKGELKKPNLKSSSFSTAVGISDYHIHDGGNVTIPIEVLREATNSFTEMNILGKGGFGIVYRGKLHDGTIIAVKRMETSMISNKGLHEFKAEIEVLKKVRHRHLVALHGFCDNGNERLLVYEYMPQGCLGQHLFDWKDMGSSPLTWNQRLTIALDVARGVEYLHSLAQQSFIHRDLKPSNILLGDDMRAKVADFGLVRIAPEGKHSLETRLAGTFGYLAPEYAATGRVTTKVDVYAFGVILMEIITGRKSLEDSLPDEQSHLVSWLRRLIPDKEAFRSALDPVLLPILNEDNFQSIVKVAELAGHCTARESHQRPDMSHAVSVLSPLVEQWKPTGDEDEEDSPRVDSDLSLPQVLQKWKANEDSSSIMS